MVQSDEGWGEEPNDPGEGVAKRKRKRKKTPSAKKTAKTKPLKKKTVKKKSAKKKAVKKKTATKKARRKKRVPPSPSGDEGSPGGPVAGPPRRRRRRRAVGAPAPDVEASAVAEAVGEPEGEQPVLDRGLPARRRKSRRRRKGGTRKVKEKPGDEAEDVVGVEEEEEEGDEGPTEKVLLVNAMDPEEVRIALLEDKQVEELYVEAAEGRSATGNVYRGRVQNVERGIGAAFVDLGRGLTGFLHVSDLPDRQPKAAIADLVEPGQEILVQVTRDSIGRKGPALTARISLPGRYLVLLTTSERSGVSRRIGKGGVRERARRFLESLELPEGMGVIVRTAGEDSRLEDLQRDLDHLLGEWKRLEALAAQSGPPALLRAESDVAERAIRDIMPTDTVRIAVDREDLAARVRTLLTTWYGPIPLRRIPGESMGVDEEVARPRPMPEVVIHDAKMPLFHAYGVEAQLEEAFRRVVRLPSGGSIVIDPTEALVSIDVNSGRSTDEEDPESTALATNLEAVKEIARQLRLRDLGGLVVLDLIDMPGRRSGRQVEKAFKRALARDRARIRVGHIGPFGCLVLSRQRVRQALSRVTHEECPSCGGTGRRRHPAGLGLRVLREMQSRAARAHGRGGLEVRVPRPVRDWILRHRASLLRDIEAGLTGPLKLEGDDRLAADGWAMKGLPPTGEPRE